MKKAWAWFVALPRWQQAAIVAGIVLVLWFVGHRAGVVSIPIFNQPGLQ